MKNLSIAFLAAVSLMTFAGCKKKPGGDTLAKMTEFKDRMCKCADKACADAVVADMNKWSAEMPKEEGKEPAKQSEEEQKVSKAYAECMTKLMTPAMTPPPAAPPPGGDKPADPAAAPPAGGDKPADPAAPPAAPPGDKPAGSGN